MSSSGEQTDRRALASNRRRTLQSVRLAAAGALLVALSAASLSGAILVQPNNYMLDDSALTSQQDGTGSLSPFLNDQAGSSEQAADRDIVGIIGDSLARLRLARMLEQSRAADPQGLMSAEIADLAQGEPQMEPARQPDGEHSLSASVASMLLDVAQAAATAQSTSEPERAESVESAEPPGAAGTRAAPRNQVAELDTSQTAAGPSKADLKTVGPIQWYNPKETIPVLKISSMATPSKYKKVYFRSEKKLVDGAFHSQTSDQEEKKALAKQFGAGVQRRSSRGSSASAPPSILQDGVIDFLKKFRDVYVQTRPAGTPPTGSNLASNIVSAASAPFAAILAPNSPGGRPNFASALSTATQLVNGAAMLSQATSNIAQAAPSSGAGAPAATTTSAGGANASALSPGKSPLTAQSYVSFWSKTFPTWVRKMLKQMRRRSLHNSSKRQQQQQHAHQHSGLGQKLASSVSGAESPAAAAAPPASSA